MHQIEEKQLIELEKISLNIYHYGSYVYQTFVKGVSDYDYIMILPDEYAKYDNAQVEYNNSQYTLYSKTTWQYMLDDNQVCAIETYFLPQEFIVKETVKFTTEIIREKIRKNFSQTASNSYVKCKKKLEVEESFAPKIGKKSLWHSLRIIDFGIQILKHKRIINYTSMNYLYKDIVLNENNDWNFYSENFKPLYNKLKTEFRLCI